jgi:FtsP/CotA-like multicopper oxidase with cupredoxin domain
MAEIAQEPGFHGTYFYHSHVDFQISTASGPIVVEPRSGGACPVEYDEEIVMMMGDYYHVSSRI